MTTGAWHVGGEQLAEFLEGRRWFGGKGRVIRTAEVADVIPVKWPASQRVYAVARVRVTTDEGTASYQVFLPPDAGDAAHLADALEDAQFLRGLVDAFVGGASLPSVDGTVRWTIASETKKAVVVPPHATIRLSPTEQTNSSVIVDGEAILKLYRRLERGVHPDVEVTRFLTVKRGFPHVPVLLGTIRFEDADGVTVAGMLQELVPGAVDGWTFALRLAAEHMSGASGRVIPFVEEARRLGSVTRGMHETLASGDRGSDFEMVPASGEDVTRWCQAARQTIVRAMDVLEAAVRDGRLPRRNSDDARAVLARRADFLDLPTRIACRIGGAAGAKARTHGDYHLGQVLRSATDRFLIIDFEGEPARPLADRRVRQSPLRDVAGMLRSFAYAAATSGKGDARADAWEQATREAFLTAYFGEPGAQPGLLPRSAGNVRHLLTLFEAEKVFYELHYELDHRPDWVWIPLHAIGALAA